MTLRLCMTRLLRTPCHMRNVKYSTVPPEIVVFTNTGTAVCWHPQQPFPYECSKPLPESKPALDSPLKISSKEAMSVFQQKHPDIVRQELMKLTFTTKHRWFPRARDKKAKKTRPDREYL